MSEDVKPMNKSALIATIATNVGVDKKVVKQILEELTALVYHAIGPAGPGKITIPDLVKITIKDVAAKPEREGVNRFTGEKMTFKAKSASKKVKVLPVSVLKEAAIITSKE